VRLIAVEVLRKGSLMWLGSLLLGLLTWAVWFGGALWGPRDFDSGLLPILVTFYTSPAGLTLAIAAYARRRRAKELVSLILNSIYPAIWLFGLGAVLLMASGLAKGI